MLLSRPVNIYAQGTKRRPSVSDPKIGRNTVPSAAVRITTRTTTQVVFDTISVGKLRYEGTHLQHGAGKAVQYLMSGQLLFERIECLPQRKGERPCRLRSVLGKQPSELLGLHNPVILKASFRSGSMRSRASSPRLFISILDSQSLQALRVRKIRHFERGSSRRGRS